MAAYNDLFAFIGIEQLFIAVIFSIVIILIAFKKYLSKKSRPSLLFGLTVTFIGASLASLVVLRALMFILPTTPPSTLFLIGIVPHILNIYLTLIGFVFFNMFAFEMTYPKHFKLLSIIIMAFLTAFGIYLIFAPFTLSEASRAFVYERGFLIFGIPILIVPFLFPAVFFLIFSISVVKSSRPKAIRSALMGGAMFIVTLAFFFELVSFGPMVDFIARMGFVVYGIIMYICVHMPNWFQNLIKWEQPE